MIVTRRTGALDYKHVTAPHVIADLNREFAVTKTNNLQPTKLDSERFAHRLGEAGI
jgi:hypothetical protein